MTDTAQLPAVDGGADTGPAPVSGPGGGTGPKPLVLVAVLVGVAVVAGVVWGLVRSGGGGGVVGTPEAAPPSTNPLTDGSFSYEVVTGPVKATDCAGNYVANAHRAIFGARKKLPAIRAESDGQDGTVVSAY